jgi:hypothetical protein
MKKLSAFFVLYLFCNALFSQSSPGGISTGLKLWLKADAGTNSTTNGAAISSWNDQSGGNRHHTQSATARQPAFVGAGGSFLMNYNPAVRFGGIGDGNANNDYLWANNYLSSTDAVHVFVVSRVLGSNGTDWITTYGFTANTNHTDWYIKKPGGRFGNVDRTNSSKSLTYGIVASLMPKSGQQRIIWNGSPQSFSNTAYSISTSVSPTFTVGMDRNNTNPMIGDIQEVIVYSGTAGADLPAASISQIQSYLGIKYGISLDSTAQPNYVASDAVTNFWTGASNIGFRNNIFGLGRDDGSSLYQKQAFSYGDSSISVHTGLLSALNSGNAGTIATDKSFLMLGDNGLSGTAGAINFASGTTFSNGVSITAALNSLSARQWRAQTTGIGSWTVNINANKFGTATYLLVGSSAAFGSGTTRAYAIAAGLASNVVINNGDYLAFASYQTGPGGVGVNLAAWLRADAGTNSTVNGAAISSWNDQSFNSRTHTQATAGKQPHFVGAGCSYLMNYNPALRFDGGDDINPATQYFNSTDAFHVFSVSRINGAGATAWQAIASFYVDYNHPDWYGQQISCRTGAVEKINTNLNVKYGLSSSLMPKTGNQTVIWNGTSSTFGNTAYTLNYTGAPYNYYSIGSDAGTDFLNGDIQEVIIYGGPGVTMSADQVQRIQSYLAIKYGISLDPAGQANYLASDNATQFWTGANNTGYQNHIFGLGRDDNSSLEQEQAYSMGDSSISVFLGNSLAPLNSLNGSSIPINYSFLMMGDNNLTGYTSYGSYSPGTAFNNENLASLLNYRTARIWKAQATTQTSWVVSINANKYASGSDASSAAYIMVSNSASFTPVSTRLYLLVNGAANNVVVNNGDYIAIGSFMKSPGGVSDQLALWTRSDDAGTSPATAWKDNSMNYNPVEATGTMALSAADANHNYYPYYGTFSASNHFYDASSSVNSTSTILSDFSVFAAIRPDASAPGTLNTGSAGRIVGIDDDVTYAAEPGFSLANNKRLVFYKFTGSENWQYSTAATTPSKSSVVYYNGSNTATAASALKIGMDGVEASVPRTGTFNYVSNRLRIGYGAWYGTYFPGDIMEVIWYKRSLTATESAQVNTYLSVKNGITLGSNAAPVNYINTDGNTVWSGSGTFQNNIAAIGRDDVEALNQKQSKSINPNSNGQVAVSLGALTASNAANTGIFVNNVSYLVWGDNGSTTSLQAASTAFTYDGFNTNIRMNRLWTVTATNFSQRVVITIPTSMIGSVTLSGCQKLRLVTASDAGFTTITSAVTNLASSGGNYTCSYTFPAGTSYFTFARIETGSEGVVDLPYIQTPSISYSTCEENGWRYWHSDGTQGSNNGTRKIFAINRNGNGNANTLNAFSGQIDYQDGPYEVTDGTNTTHIMGRTITINDGNASPAPYTVNGGMKIRFYFDSSELNSAMLDAAVSSIWFKHSGNLASTLADQTPSTINNISYFSNPSGGNEDGQSYVELSSITSFSTFGFASNSGMVISLPGDLISFKADWWGKQSVFLAWTTANEQNAMGFDIERSENGSSWRKIGFVAAQNFTGIGASYSFEDKAPDEKRNYYRLVMRGYATGDIKYSKVIFVKAAGSGVLRLFPNPVASELHLRLGSISVLPENIFIYNIQGQRMNSIGKLRQSEIEFNIQNLPAGLYYMKIVSTDGAVYVKNFLKQ